MEAKFPWMEQAFSHKASTASKVMTIVDVVHKYIRPQQVIQIGERGIPQGGPYALQNEIIRQFYGKFSEFTIVIFGGNANNLAAMLHVGMVKKVVSCFMGDSYPNPSPNPLIQKAYAEGKVEFEEWTMLTLMLRLMAGALGLPFLPTKSVIGSSLAENNKNFHVLPDPFGSSPVGLVCSLTPDICLTHAWLADEQGNAVIYPPYGGNVYGALAAKEGVIVSAERIVSTEELLQYREHIRIPSAYVKAVVEAPFGSHPSGHSSFPQQEKLGYREDKAFILQSRRACRSAELMNEWLETWILGCRNHDEYLQKLGADRLTSLKENSPYLVKQADQTNPVSANMPAQPTDEEKMIVAAARQIKKTVLKKNYRSVFTGIGAAHMACWLAYYLLRDEGHSVRLLADNGLNGYVPLPGDAYLFSSQNMATGELYNDIFHTLGIFVQGAQAHCLAVMGAAQIDGFGNINSSKIPQSSTYLMGAGGGNDAASGATEVVAVVKQSKLRFRNKIDYVTSPGQRVKTIVTQYGVFQKDDRGTFCLSAYLENPACSEIEIVKMIRNQCGWDFSVLPTLEVIAGPTAEELDRLRQLDPERLFLGK